MPTAASVAPARLAAATAARAAVTTDFPLPAGTLLAIHPRPGLTIQCVTGAVWLTQADDARDVILRRGDTHTPAPGGKIVLQALTAARIRTA